MVKLSLILLFFLFIQEANGQEEIELDPVTITSSLHPVKASNTGRNILVIKGETFLNTPVNSIDELLRFIPGIELQARGPMGVQSDLVIRGGTFQQVLVIIDGIRLNDPLTGHFNSYIPISPAEIERIEVLKGASSALYGSEAVGGVVHIITKSFSAKREKQNRVSAQLTAGDYGLLNSNVGGFFSDGKKTFGAGLLTNNADGQPQRGIKGYFHLHTASLSFSQQLNKNVNVAVRTGYDSRDFAAQNFYTTFISDTATEKVKSLWNHFRLQYERLAHRLTFHVGYKQAEDKYVFNKRVLPNVNKSVLWQAQVDYEHAISDRSSIITGTQFINRAIRSNDRGNHAENQYGAFFLYHRRFGSSFHFSPALRLHRNEQSGTEWIPQVNLSYRGTLFQLRGSAGKTVRTPDFTERYNNYNKPLVTSGSIGNPDLEAEQSISYEGGMDFFVNRKIKISQTFFKRQHKKLIDFVLTPYAQMPRKNNLAPNGMFALAKNIAEVTTTGFEMDIQFSQSLPLQKALMANAGLVWLNTESSEAAPSFYISSHAKFLINMMAGFSTKRATFSVTGLYKSRAAKVSLPINAVVSQNYFVANAKAEGKLIKNILGLFIQVDNIFGKKYSDLLGSQMPGRWMMGGIKLTL